MKSDISSDLERRIIHHLLLHASLGNDIGLFNGKMGLVLFFAHYNRKVNNLVFEDTADELMDDIYHKIHTEMPIGFGSGLSGIGWGIEYLIQNGFVEGRSIEVCNEIDLRIMERAPLRITDYSLENGLCGILHYVLAHIKGCFGKESVLPFDGNYLSDLFTCAIKLTESNKISSELKEIAGKYVLF